MENNNTKNILSQLKTKQTAYSVGAIYIFLMLLTLILLYNHGSLFEKIDPTKTADKNNMGLTIFAIITFTLLAIAFVIVLLPSFENIENLFGQMQKTMYVVIYTIFLILL